MGQVTIIDFNKATRQGEAIKGTVDADDIRRRLHADARGFVEWLFSGRALCTKGEARIGNVQGEPGASLSIKLTGSDEGLWHDHATGEGGDLIALYRASMGYVGNTNFQLSLKEIAKEYFGDPVEVDRLAWQPSAVARIENKKRELGTKPRDDMVELGAPVATYRYYDTRGNVIASVVRYEPGGTRESKTFRPYCFKTVDGKTKWIGGAPDLRPLYRLPEIALASVIVLCEGEGKADALARMGIEATSAMQGANAPIDKTDWSPLHGKTVIIWPDNDEPGFAYAKAAAARLQAIGCTVRMVDVPADKPKSWDAGDCVMEGQDPRPIIDRAVGGANDPPSRIRILDIDQIDNLEPPSWLVDGIITEAGLSVLWGRSGAMKSFVALDIALCIASGLEWHGKPVKHGLALYIAAEGAHGLGRRVIGWRKTRGKDLPTPNFKLVPHTIAMTGDDLDILVGLLLKMREKPALIVIDTLARTFGAGDENKQSDMNAYVSAADKLREATGAHVMIIHHSGVHEDRRERGSNVLRGAADTVIKVSRKGEAIDIINAGPEGKQKDAEEFETVKLRTAKAYFEHKSGEQNTLVLNLRETEKEEKTGGDQKPIPKLKSVQQAVFDALKGSDRPLGVTSLTAMTGKFKANILDAIDRLMEMELVKRTTGEDETPQLWSVT